MLGGIWEKFQQQLGQKTSEHTMVKNAVGQQPFEPVKKPNRHNFRVLPQPGPAPSPEARKILMGPRGPHGQTFRRA